MNVCKRFLAVIILLLGVAGLLLSLAGGVGVWFVKEPVKAKAIRIFERIEAALDIANQGLDHVKVSLARAAERLDSVREEQRRLAQEPRSNNALGSFLARTVQQTLAPEFSKAHETFHTVAEATLVANTVLENLGSFPFLSVAGLEIGDLTEINNRLTQVESSAWTLSRLLGQTGPAPDSDEASTQLSRVEQTLKTMQGMLTEFESKLTLVRQRTEELKSKTLHWITPASVLIALVCFWIALSQVSLLAHAWSWLRR
jgi:hypothetical protein